MRPTAIQASIRPYRASVTPKVQKRCPGRASRLYGPARGRFHPIATGFPAYPNSTAVPSDTVGVRMVDTGLSKPSRTERTGRRMHAGTGVHNLFTFNAQNFSFTLRSRDQKIPDNRWNSNDYRSYPHFLIFSNFLVSVYLSIGDPRSALLPQGLRGHVGTQSPSKGTQSPSKGTQSPSPVPKVHRKGVDFRYLDPWTLGTFVVKYLKSTLKNVGNKGNPRTAPTAGGTATTKTE
ncbi:hypothetical protein D2E23_2254 [Bifidobacterium callimiconis]|uniref:Uncharacterized protein n=1 Tax=Bifidobacterium callimiconis TaxID=2306973 RepID=A0A430F6G9_9BIFI|nr:hypothetical protein D2E23_2254 [Bifidobacterium callimiconis]